MKISISGAGLGGLTLAIALERAGHEVLLWEKRAAFGREGAGIVLGPNVLAALELLGLAAPITALGRPVSFLNITDQKGRVLARSSYSLTDQRHPAVAIHRGVLREVLRSAFQGTIHFGREIDTYEVSERPSFVAAGQRHEVDLLVGADGIRSALRRELNPDFATRYSGYTCFRFVVPTRITDEVFEMWGRGQRIGVVPLGGDQTYVFMTMNRPARAERPFSSLDELRGLFSDFTGVGREALLALSDLESVLHNDLEDGLSPRFWAPGAVLLGDAAHAVTPNMGQGAGLAIEDALCLAALLDELGPTNAALERYEAYRRPRARWILDQSHTLGRVAQLEGSVVRWLRNLALRLTPPSTNTRALRRIVSEMPGVPVAGRLGS